MTRATAKKDGDRYKLLIRNHATGSPEVCAAVSGIAFALAGYLENARDVLTELDYTLSEANADFRFSGGKEAETAWNMAVIGLKQIEASNPEYFCEEIL